MSCPSWQVIPSYPSCHYQRPTAAVPRLALLLLLFKAATVCLSHFTLHFDCDVCHGLAPAAPRLGWPRPRRHPDPFFWVLFSQLWRGDACHRPPTWWPWKIWRLIWGSDVANAVHNQKFNTRGHHKCALSNIKIVWTHFKRHIITVEGNYRCSSFRW